MDEKTAQYLLARTIELKRLVSHELTGKRTGRNAEYQELRTELLLQVPDHAPPFLATYRSLDELYREIHDRYLHFHQRRDFVHVAFEPLFRFLDSKVSLPCDKQDAEILGLANSIYVRQAWQTASRRKFTDPDGAITAARTLIESVCKHILDSRSVTYGDQDLPELYTLTAKALGIAPGQTGDKVMKQILGGCQAIVEGVGALRNRLGDAHGKERKWGQVFRIH